MPVQRFLARHDLALWLALLAVLVCAPALGLGWVADDLVHQVSILGVDEYPEAKRSTLDLFRFASGEREENRRAIDAGFWPWWSAEDLRLSFFRPVTGLTHGLDYALWPRSPMLMHAHSLLWLAFGVVAATRLYRRLLPSAPKSSASGGAFRPSPTAPGVHCDVQETPDAGFLAPPGTPWPGDESPQAVNPTYVFQMLDHLFRDNHLDPLELGERIELTDLTIEVTAVQDGRPSEVSFRFAQPLEDPVLRWLRWNDGVFVPFELPADGETVVLEPARIRWPPGS